MTGRIRLLCAGLFAATATAAPAVTPAILAGITFRRSSKARPT
jgi:hypothetical protein